MKHPELAESLKLQYRVLLNDYYRYHDDDSFIQAEDVFSELCEVEEELMGLSETEEDDEELEKFFDNV